MIEKFSCQFIVNYQLPLVNQLLEINYFEFDDEYFTIVPIFIRHRDNITVHLLIVLYGFYHNTNI